MKEDSINLTQYIIGFICSLLLTLAAYFIVVGKFLGGSHLLFAIGGFAAVQAFIQLIYFFHLANEPSPPWKLFVFLFMLLIVAVVVIGTIWIMYNLDYRMMPKM